jgi:hypothetical protein
VNLINTLEMNKNTTATPITPHMINSFGGDTGKYGSDQNRNGNGNCNAGGNVKYRNEVQYQLIAPEQLSI